MKLTRKGGGGGGEGREVSSPERSTALDGGNDPLTLPPSTAARLLRKKRY